jgi:hypothetical protein
MTAPPKGTVLLLGIHDRPAGRHVHGGVRQGQPHREGGADAFSALHSDGTPVLLHNAPRAGHPIPVP